MNSQEKYAMLDQLNLCHRCEKARPAPGRKFCFDCLEKIAEYNAQHYSQKKAHEYQARRRVLYQEKKAAGICVRCSKPATHGIYCYECSIKAKRHNSKTAQKRKAERHEAGLVLERRKQNGQCLRCGSKADEGFYCQKCLAQMKQALDKAREKSPFREMERARIEKERCYKGWAHGQ